MVCYLENYDAERISEIFLGEFDTPEAIWSSEMRQALNCLCSVFHKIFEIKVIIDVVDFVCRRRLMIEKIAAHVADFSPRLQSNTRALYQYCPIPVISFPQLDNELFCNIYYLRHLCDVSHFPDWPIKDPVSLISTDVNHHKCSRDEASVVWNCPIQFLQVKLLKDTLEAWKKEVEKKPPSMSVDDAYDVLNLPKGQGQWVAFMFYSSSVF